MLTGCMIETNVKEQKCEVTMSTAPERTQPNKLTEPDRSSYTTADAQRERANLNARAAAERRRKSLAKWTQFGALVIITLESALAFRFLFKMIAANPGNPFAAFLYHVTQPFAALFFGLVPDPSFGGSVFEFSTLIGMAIYGAVYWIIIRLIWVVFNPTKAIDADKYEPDL